MNLPSVDLQRLLAEEPFVRALAESLVAGEADDVVQRAYLRALGAKPSAVREPRSWLARVVRNLVADDRRRRRRAVVREAQAAAAPHVPSSAELAASEELRRLLVTAVDALPAHLRTVVLLRYFEGLPPRRIADSLAVPVSVVWNRLHAALVALRARLDAEHGGDRRAWMLPLMPFATSPQALPWLEVTSAAPTVLPLGVISMTMKTKLAALAAMVLAGGLLWSLLPGPAPQPVDGSPNGRAIPAAAVASDAAMKQDPLPETRRESVLPRPAATTGELVVSVRYATEPTIAAGRPVLVRRRGGDLRVGVLRATSDANGTARFPAVPPGEVRVRVGASMVSAAVTIEVGQSSHCELTLRGGMTLNGVVVDTGGAPIAGAVVEMGRPAMTGVDAEAVAVTSADGTFALRECDPVCVIGARAAGYAASQLYFRTGEPGGRESVRIELTASGGTVEGTVVDQAGAPIADAVVRIGEGRMESILSTSQGAPPLPAQVETDADGRFTAIGVPVGTQPVFVRTADCAPWIGTCEVVAHTATWCPVVMQPGVTCAGRVSQGGQPVADAKVTCDLANDFLRIVTTSGADGAYQLRGLPVGDFELSAAKFPLGRVQARVHGEPGVPTSCDLDLGNGIALRGRMLDASGSAASGAWLRCRAEGAGEQWSAEARTDQAGGFLIAPCPSRRTLSIEATLRDHLPWQRSGIDPAAGELEIRLAKDSAPRARITGRLLRPDGTAATGVKVESWCQSMRIMVDATVEDPNGAFALEVAAGTWSIRVITNGHPQIRRDGIEMQPGAVHDLGPLQLVRGGTLVIHDDAAMKCVYNVFDPHERWVAYLSSPVPPTRSDLLAPGEYLLFARAEGSAAQVLPFSIVAERETELTVNPVPGIRRRLEFVRAAGGEAGAVSFEIRRAGARVTGNYVEARSPLALVKDVWLVPGEYELTTTMPAPKVSVRFEVAEGTNDPVLVQLR